MHIFEQDGKIRLQLMDLFLNQMLFDFTVEPEKYNGIRAHIIKHLIEYEPSIKKHHSKEFFNETIHQVLVSHHVYENKIDNAVINDAVMEIQKYLDLGEK